MNRRNFITSIGLAGAGLAFSRCSSLTQDNKNPLPNIVYILADDMGYGDVRALNPQSKIPTPTLSAIFTTAG